MQFNSLIFKRKFFIPIFLLIFIIYLGKGQDIIWIGGNGDWDVPSNWDLNRLPAATDSVYIPTGSNVFLQNLSAVDITNLRVNGQLNIGSNVSLTIDGSQDYGIQNYGLFINSGSVHVRNTGSHAIKNNGSFNNNNQIVISSGIGNIGIWSDSTIFNSKNSSIWIANTISDGMYFLGGHLANHGTINMTSGIGGAGIELFGPQSYIFNSPDGVINILSSHYQGIYIHPTNYVENFGTITTKNSVVECGIENDGKFTNFSGSSLVIDNTDREGFINKDTLNISINSTVEISNNTFAGITNLDGGKIESNGIVTFSGIIGGDAVQNLSTSKIEIYNGEWNILTANKYGIFNAINAVINNGSKIYINSIPFDGVVNESNSTITNFNNGEIVIENSIINSATLNNDGLIRQNFDKSGNQNTGTINNIGLIEDYNHSFSGLNFNNQGYLFVPLVGNIQEGQSYSPLFLGLGNNWNFSFPYVYDTTLTYSYGSITGSNWTPNAAAPGHSQFKVQLYRYGITKQLNFRSVAPVQRDCDVNTWLGGTGNWSIASNWSKGRVPYDCDDVIINSGIVNINAQDTAIARSIVCRGEINVAQQGYLILDAPFNLGLRIENKLNNYGNIELNGAYDDIFLIDDGSVINHPTGKITIGDVTVDGLLLFGNSTFSNSGMIEFLDTVGASCISLHNQSIFANTGHIKSYNSVNSSEISVTDTAQFFNQVGGLVELGKSQDGIFLRDSASFFINEANVIFRDSCNYGMDIKGSFKNLQGIVDMQYIRVHGIYFRENGSVENMATFKIQSPQALSSFVDNGSPFNFINEFCGKFYTDLQLGLGFSGKLINRGFLHYASSMGGFDASYIENFGSFEDIYNVFSSGFLVNDGLHIRPIPGLVQEGNPVNNALGGMLSTLAIVNNQWYDSPFANQSAGNYDPNQNTWMPNSNAVGKNKFWVVLEDTGSSCTDTMEINLDFPVAPACSPGTTLTWIGIIDNDWHNTQNWDLNRLPLTCEEVIIPAGFQVEVIPGNLAVARSILLEGNLINDGQLTITGAGDRPGIENFRGSFTNNGDLFIADVIGGNGNNHGIKSHGTGATTINSGVITIDNITDHGILSENGSALTLNGTINIANTGQDAILTGIGGIVNGTAILNLGTSVWSNSDLLEIGNSVGLIQNNGYFNTSASSGIRLEIEGANGKGVNGGHDAIEVTGDLSLDGDLEIILVNGYVPEEGKVFDVFNYTGVLSGAFSHVVFPSPEMDGWQIDYGNLKSNKILLFKPMVNDLCINNIPIVQTEVSTTMHKGHTYAASNSDHPGTCDRDLSTAPGIWYKLTVSNFLDYRISFCDADFDTQVGLFYGSCGSLTCLKGNDDDNGPNGLNVCSATITSSIGLTSAEIENIYPGQLGGDIYIYVTGYSTHQGAFVMEIESSIPLCTPNGNVWLGGGSNAWNDASQWSLNHIPLRCENVIIPSGPPVTIPFGYNAFASSIQLQGFVLNNGGTLEVSGAFQQPGIDVNGGTLDNQGTIIINNISGNLGYGIDGGPTATILNTGVIVTTNVDDVDIYLRNGVNYQNSGYVELKN